ncbi:DNA-binding transcriptional LysR family regulator [Actinomadura coerulea]|uniref:DNA-binding transcriptional LysR family regulator n=1 Tax=Actinomadura coerulea TaxID=46159 RepID=A0A7X0L277_9ACTN|nr:LysR substrate-binding domain-containing protein [Actinomadura coerulea]MBB6399257.1 DNA-binding transcriptional LysR family regulator [Actinomadura coerulea]GGQ24452.1 LysR family transcriptional regulator [Actinomadura coerulea]
MELRQLEYFVAVAEEAGFTRAAARLHVAQPGVSAQIRQLERELGQPLFDRSGRTVRLTEVGAAVLPYARAALAAVEGAGRAVDELTGLLRGHVTIGTIDWIRSLDLPGMLAGFHRDHPDVEITVVQEDSAALTEGLRTGRIDLAYLSLGADPPEGLATRVVIEQELVAAVARAHPLARRSTITLRALAGESLICLPKGTGLRSVLDAAFADAGLRPHVAFEAGEPPVLAEIAAHGLGVAVLPESAARDRPDGLRALPVVRPRLTGRIALAWRAEGPRGPAARALIARARRWPA